MAFARRDSKGVLSGRPTFTQGGSKGVLDTVPDFNPETCPQTQEEALIASQIFRAYGTGFIRMGALTIFGNGDILSRESETQNPHISNRGGGNYVFIYNRRTREWSPADATNGFEGYPPPYLTPGMTDLPFRFLYCVRIPDGRIAASVGDAFIWDRESERWGPEIYAPLQRVSGSNVFFRDNGSIWEGYNSIHIYSSGGGGPDGPYSLDVDGSESGLRVHPRLLDIKGNRILATQDQRVLHTEQAFNINTGGRWGTPFKAHPSSSAIFTYDWARFDTVSDDILYADLDNRVIRRGRPGGGADGAYIWPDEEVIPFPPSDLPTRSNIDRNELQRIHPDTELTDSRGTPYTWIQQSPAEPGFHAIGSDGGGAYANFAHSGPVLFGTSFETPRYSDIRLQAAIRWAENIGNFGQRMGFGFFMSRGTAPYYHISIKADSSLFNESVIEIYRREAGSQSLLTSFSEGLGGLAGTTSFADMTVQIVDGNVDFTIDIRDFHTESDRQIYTYTDTSAGKVTTPGTFGLLLGLTYDVDTRLQSIRASSLGGPGALVSPNKAVLGKLSDLSNYGFGDIPGYTPAAPGKTALGSIPSYSLPGGTSKSLLDDLPKISQPDNPQQNNSPAEGIPIVTGMPNIGNPLTVDTSNIVDWNGLTNVEFAYQWLRLTEVGTAELAYQWRRWTLDPEDQRRPVVSRILGYDDGGPTYTTTERDFDDDWFIGYQIRATVRVTHSDGTVEFINSVYSPIIGAPEASASRISSAAPFTGGTLPLTGGADVGDTLTVDTSSIMAGGDTQTVTTPIAGATDRTYTTTLADVGSQLRVIVTYTDDAGFSERIESPPTAIIGQANLTVSGLPIITGTPLTGETLTVDTSGISDANGLDGVTFSYEWKFSNDSVSDVVIPGAGGTSLLLGAELAGGTITVTVSYTDNGGFDESVTSAPTAVVRRANVPATGAPTITGDTEVGQTLTADTSGITDINGLSSATFAYQWKRVTAGVVADISGATDQAYVLSSADERTTLRVTVTYTDDDGYAESLTSRDSATIVPANNPATGAPTVTGTATEGQVLTASETGIMDTNGLTTATFLWRWIRVDENSEAAIQGATGTTYTITAADVGKRLKVRVSFVDDANHMEELESVSTAPVQAFNYPPTGLPLITGTVLTGSTLSVDTSQIADRNGLAGVAFSYQWLSQAEGVLVEHIERGTGAEYNIPLIKEGTQIAVAVTFTDDGGYTHTLTSAYTQVVQRGNIPATGTVWVDGPLLLGQAVSGGHALIDDDNGLTNPTLSYQWVRVTADQAQRTPINRATLQTYTPGEADIGHYLLFEVSFTDDDGYKETLSSPFGRLVIRTNRQHTGTVVVVGQLGVGSTLSVDLSGVMDPDGLTNPLPSYRWLRDGVDIRPPARGATYVPTPDDIGHMISVRVIMRDDTGFSVLSQSPEVGPIVDANRPATGQPTISGDVTHGEVLTADTSGIADPDGIANATFVYRWVRLMGLVEEDITGATARTYTLVAADVGHRLLVRVTFTDDRGFHEGLTSDPTDMVEALVNTPATGSPMITGVARETQTLTADTSGITDVNGLTDTVFAYQWLRDGTDISGATSGGTYTLTRADIGSSISVRVTFTDDDGFTEMLTSPATAAVLSNNSAVGGAVTITGTLAVGETLTADTSGITDANGLTMVMFAHQWIRGTSDISGATSRTYEIVAADVGESLKLRVTFTDDAGYDETVESAGTTAIPSPVVNTPATGQPTISGLANLAGELTVDTSGIMDANGLTSVTFARQWIRVDGMMETDIAGETGTSYFLVQADVGKTVKVRVSFTDDDGFDESLTSPATAEVTAEVPVFGEVDMLTPIGTPGVLSTNTRRVTFDVATRTAFQAAWNSGAYTFFVVQLGWVDNSIQRYGEATISRIPGLTLANTEVRFLLPEDRWLAGNDGRAELINGATELTLDTSNSARFPTGMTAQLYGASSSLQINPNVDATNTLDKIAIGGTVYALSADAAVVAADGPRTVGTTGSGDSQALEIAGSFFTRRAGSASAVTFNSLIIYPNNPFTSDEAGVITIGTYDGTNSELLLSFDILIPGTMGHGPLEIQLPSTVQIPGDKGFYITASTRFSHFAGYNGSASSAIAAPDDFDFAGGYLGGGATAPNMIYSLAFTLSYSYTTIAVTPAGPRTVGTTGIGTGGENILGTYFTRRAGSTSVVTFNSLILYSGNDSSSARSSTLTIGTYDGTNSEILLSFEAMAPPGTEDQPIEIPLPSTVRIPGDKGFYIILGGTASAFRGYNGAANNSIAAPHDFDFAGGYYNSITAPNSIRSLAFTLSYTTIPDATLFDTTGPYLGFQGVGNWRAATNLVCFTRKAGSTDAATLTHITLFAASGGQTEGIGRIRFGTYDGTTVTEVAFFDVAFPATESHITQDITQPFTLELPANLVVPGDKGFCLSIQAPSSSYQILQYWTAAAANFITDSDDFEYAMGSYTSSALTASLSDASPFIRLRYTV